MPSPKRGTEMATQFAYEGEECFHMAPSYWIWKVCVLREPTVYI